mgnify:CR=1 FL=1
MLVLICIYHEFVNSETAVAVSGRREKAEELLTQVLPLYRLSVFSKKVKCDALEYNFWVNCGDLGEAGQYIQYCELHL